MTLHHEPPMVGIEEILDDVDEAEQRATRSQVLLVVAGGVVGIAGLLTLLVVSAPSWLELIRVIAALTSG
jgi:hypothetical protein